MTSAALTFMTRRATQKDENRSHGWTRIHTDRVSINKHPCPSVAEKGLWALFRAFRGHIFTRRMRSARPLSGASTRSALRRERLSSFRVAQAAPVLSPVSPSVTETP